VLALAWALRKPVISSLITGASKPAQLDSNLAASGLTLSADVLSEIEKILSYKPFYRKIG
jgi:aryl-alcohol dehydrogenase-like predicted oxidoreductase